jgi:hypothetical protein
MARVVLAAVHQVTFPISNPAPFLDDQRPLVDMALVRMPKGLASAIWQARLAFEAQVRFSALPAAMHPIVDRLMRQYSRTAAATHVPDDLFRRERGFKKLLQFHLQLEIVVDDERRGLCKLPAPEHAALGVDLVVDPAGVGVALDFSHHRCPVFAKDSAEALRRICVCAAYG